MTQRKQTYAVVFEQSPNNYCAYVPDLPGCVSTGKTLDEMRAMIREAIAFHIEGMVEHGEAFPEPRMSLAEAADYHRDAVAEYDEETLAEFAGAGPDLPTTFEMVDVEVSAPQAARAS
ncbi:MAG: hypothetical protein F4Y94_07610 [Chloroflexi bacterium]|nr:hypothetical protein [Chloroflexota bacterium]